MRLRTTKAIGAALCATLVVACMAGSSQAARSSSATTQRAQVGGATVALAILKEVGIGVAQGAGSQAMVMALSMMGIGGDPGTAAALAEIQKGLERANTQLTTLRDEAAAIAKQVGLSDFNNAAREAVPILRAIDHAEEKVRAASSYPPGSPHGKLLAEEARNYIGAHLLDKGKLLAGLVSSNGLAVPTSIIGAAFNIRTLDNFMDHTDSVQIRYLVDYYTVYEAELMQLVASYYLADPAYPRREITRLTDEMTGIVQSQIDGRKDVVPVDTVVDVRSHLMWATKAVGVTQDPRHVIQFGSFGSQKVISWFLLVHVPQLTGGLTDWTMPTKAMMENLVKGWNGNADDWLAQNGGFTTPLRAGEGNQNNPEFWTQTLESYTNPNNTELYIYWVMDMRNGDVIPRVVNIVNGNLSQHGYLAVRGIHPGAYVP